MLEIEGKTILSRLVDALSPHVARVHVVIGYREELIIDHCALHHRDVILVRNPEFRTTNTAQSMHLGAAGMAGKVLFLDGDLVIQEDSLAAFIAEASLHPMLVGIAPTRSEQAVCVEMSPDAAGPTITRFTRDGGHPYEWANVVAGPADMLTGATSFVFERLAGSLPLAAREIDLREVDTPADLDLATSFAAGLRK
jgi:CTP:molybdopterin cytidylyltransferase MocA